MQTYADSSKIAKALLSVDAVLLRPHEPFTFASGIKSPVYTDCRKTISSVFVREEIAKTFAAIVQQLGNVDVIAGTASAGIPHAAWLAQLLHLPMIYVRSGAKEHGTKKLVEGIVEKGKRAVLIEDTISTGGSSVEAAKVLQAEGIEVVAILAIYSHGFRVSFEKFSAANLRLHVLCQLEDVLKEALAQKKLTTHQIAVVQKWKSEQDAGSRC